MADLLDIDQRDLHTASLATIPWRLEIMSLLARAALWRQPPLDRTSTLERTASLDALPSSRIAAPLPTTPLYHQIQLCHPSACILARQESTRMNCPNARKSCTRTRQKTTTPSSYLKIEINKIPPAPPSTTAEIKAMSCTWEGGINASRAKRGTLSTTSRNGPRQLRIISIWPKRTSLFPLDPTVLTNNEKSLILTVTSLSRWKGIHLGPFFFVV